MQKNIRFLQNCLWPKELLSTQENFPSSRPVYLCISTKTGGRWQEITARGCISRNGGKKPTNLKEETDTSVASLGFGVNVQEENDAAYNASVQNLSDGFQANAAAFLNLTKVKNMLGNNVNVGMVQMQTQINQLTELV